MARINWSKTRFAGRTTGNLNEEGEYRKTDLAARWLARHGKPRKLSAHSNKVRKRTKPPCATHASLSGGGPVAAAAARQGVRPLP
jgi:hypothetical protein